MKPRDIVHFVVCIIHHHNNKLNFISYSKTEVDIPTDFHILNWIWLYRRNITSEICICTCKWSVFNLLINQTEFAPIHVAISKCQIKKLKMCINGFTGMSQSFDNNDKLNYQNKCVIYIVIPIYTPSCVHHTAEF
jgi:hypothetical protein